MHARGKQRGMIDRPGFRPTEWAVVVLALLAGLWGAVLAVVLRTSQGVFHAATAPAFIILVLTSVHMWARRSGQMSSTRYLAMFSAVLALFVAMSGFLLRESPVYAWGELALGGLLFAALAYEAWISLPSQEGQRPLDPRTNV